MRVGIVTVYDSGNYGSFLQAFAMKKYLEDRGHQVFFIKHRSFLKIVIKEILIGMKQGIKHGPGIFIHRVKKCLYQYRDLKNFNVLSNNKRKTRELDLLLLGSDEIWNIRKPYFKNLIFFGKYKENIKTIAFAVSCGMAEEEDYPEEIVNQLKKISRIYVRDEFSKQIVKNICDRDVDIVMDPTLLQVPFWKNMNKPRKIKEEYLLVYGYKFSEKQFHNIKRYAKENGLKTVAVCLYQTWCDKNLNISALDFYNVLENAVAVVTSTFHGSIFATLSNEKILIYNTSKKVVDIVSKLGVSNHLLSVDSSYEEFINVMNKKNVVDYTSVYENNLDKVDGVWNKINEEMKK